MCIDCRLWFRVLFVLFVAGCMFFVVDVRRVLFVVRGVCVCWLLCIVCCFVVVACYVWFVVVCCLLVGVVCVMCCGLSRVVSWLRFVVRCCAVCVGCSWLGALLCRGLFVGLFVCCVLVGLCCACGCLVWVVCLFASCVFDVACCVLVVLCCVL